MKSLEELVNVDQGAWEELQGWVKAAGPAVEVLACNTTDGDRVLQCLQVTTKSYLGTVAYRTGGILLDGGWLRILGAGQDRLPRDLCRWNHLDANSGTRFQNALLVADDVVGGFFAINGGAFGPKPGNVFYLAPDNLEWEDLETNYGGFLQWAMSGNRNQFYETMRWPGWEQECATINGSQSLSIYPPLWGQGEPIGQRSRRPIPIDEAWGVTLDFQKQLGPRKK